MNSSVHGFTRGYEDFVKELDLNDLFVGYEKVITNYRQCPSTEIWADNAIDRQFCSEIENWLNTAIQRSTLISGSSEKQRYQFFNRQRQKICALMDKILKNSNGN